MTDDFYGEWWHQRRRQWQKTYIVSDHTSGSHKARHSSQGVSDDKRLTLWKITQITLGATKPGTIAKISAKTTDLQVIMPMTMGATKPGTIAKILAKMNDLQVIMPITMGATKPGTVAKVLETIKDLHCAWPHQLQGSSNKARHSSQGVGDDKRLTLCVTTLITGIKQQSQTQQPRCWWR